MAVDLKALRTVDTFLRVPDLASIFGVTRRVIYTWIEKGKLPPQVQLAGFNGWDPDELRKFLGVK